MTRVEPSAAPSAPARSGSPSWALPRLAARHPLGTYIGMAWVGSWLLWIPAIAGVGGVGWVAFVLGGMVPMLSAWLVLRWSGGDVGAWARRIVLWRVPARWWLYALGVPALLFGVVNVELALLGERVDLGSLPGRVPGYLATLAVVATVGGGFEEPGWRGFALPRLQQRHAPVVATLVLGLVWGIWHVPLYGPLGFLLPTCLAFYYTWLYNRTGSVLLCIVLHASFTPALDHLVLAADSMTVDLLILGTVAAGAAVLVAASRGRLGLGAAIRP